MPHDNNTHGAGAHGAPAQAAAATAQAARPARPWPLAAAALLLAAAFVAGAVGTTQAVTRFIGDSVHIIDTAGVAARIVEDYDGAEGIYPGAEVDKAVNVTNTGEADILVRVRVEKRWGGPAPEPASAPAAASPAPAEALPTDSIAIHYNDTMWLYDEADGYFYYRGVLAPGQTTSEPLFTGFSVDPALGNEYQGLSGFITVRMECVQAAGGGASAWGKTHESLGIPEWLPGGREALPARSTFMGGAPADFVFTPEGTDLFGNFKRLMPGETRTQAIEVANAYTRGVEVFLRAEDIAQGADPRLAAAADDGAAAGDGSGPAGDGTPDGSDGAALALLAPSAFTEGQLALIDRLLREHVAVVVTASDGATVYDGPVWGRPDADEPNPHAMRNDISLGFFAPGEERALNVSLQVDPALGNEYQDLMGLIHWVWTAELQEDPPPPPPPPPPPDDPPPPPPAPPEQPKPAPKTGDTAGLVLWASLTALSGAALLLLAVRSRRALPKRPE